jgi:hypothetical protein
LARAYYGSRISPNQTKTPEGYLILHNVPIARTGTQEYLGSEIGVDAERVTVNRTEEEVFSPATIASFEGKPVTSDHPKEDVRPDNISQYLRGVTTNVRRGTGEESDLLLADLIIYDPILIAHIEAGKKEISCGYDCNYVPVDNMYEQQQIRGNHVAVVDSGRAGPRVKIKDSEIKERGKKMKFSLNTIFGLGMKEFAKDASPEELAEAMQSNKEEKEPAKDAEPADEMLTTLKAIVTRLEALEAKETAQQDKEPDALDELEEELKGEATDNDSEESVTVEPETMDEEPEEEKKEKAADSKAGILASIKAMKPIVAEMTNPIERKKASDALAKVMRDQMPKTPAKQADAYKAMAKPKKTADSKQADQAQFGKNCASRNPHVKQGGK